MNIQHSSESAEHGTPKYIIDPTRELLRGIDLDPASSDLFNTVVRAKRIYQLLSGKTQEGSGYLKKWKGSVLLNPPGGLCEFESGRSVYVTTKTRRGCKFTGSCGLKPGHEHTGVTSSAKAWYYRLAWNWHNGFTTNALFVGFSLEILQSAQVEYPDGSDVIHLPQDFPYCIPKTRIPFNKENGEGELEKGAQPTHSNILVFMPSGDKSDKTAFFDLFSPIGKCTWPDRMPKRAA